MKTALLKMNVNRILQYVKNKCIKELKIDNIWEVSLAI